MHRIYMARNIRFLKFTKLSLLRQRLIAFFSSWFRRVAYLTSLWVRPNDDVFFSMNLLVFLVYVCPRCCGWVCVGDYGRWVRGGGPGWRLERLIECRWVEGRWLVVCGFQKVEPSLHRVLVLLEGAALVLILNVVLSACRRTWAP